MVILLDVPHARSFKAFNDVNIPVVLVSELIALLAALSNTLKVCVKILYILREYSTFYDIFYF